MMTHRPVTGSLRSSGNVVVSRQSAVSSRLSAVSSRQLARLWLVVGGSVSRQPKRHSETLRSRAGRRRTESTRRRSGRDKSADGAASRYSQASRTMRRCLRQVTASAASPNARPSRAFTSTNTSVAPSRAMMSNSPPRQRCRRATIAYPRRSSSPQARSSPVFPRATRSRVMAGKAQQYPRHA